MPNTFHNSAAFAYFPVLFLGGAVSTLNSTYPDKVMELGAFFLASSVDETDALAQFSRHQKLQIRVG